MSQLSATSPAAKQNWIVAWAYARRELVFVSWALMEVSLLVPLSLAILPWADEWWGQQKLFLGLFLLMLASFYLARFLARIQLPARDQRNILLGAGLLLLFLAVRNVNYQPEGLFDFSWIGQSLRNLAIAQSNLWLRDLFLLMLTGLCWWRGITLLNRDIDVVRVGQRFRVGSLYIAPFIVLLAAIRLDWSVLPFLLFYFAVSLTAVALTRAETVEKGQMALLSSLSPRWLGFVVMLSVITTFLAGGTAVFVSSSPGETIGQWLGPVWQALRWAGSAIGLTVSYLFSPLLSSLEAALQFLVRFFQQAIAILFEANPDAPPDTDSGWNGLLQAYNEWMLHQERGAPGILSSVNWRLVIIGVVVLLTLFILVQYYRKQFVTVGNGRFGKIMLDITNRLPFTRTRRERTKSKNHSWHNWRTAVSIINIYLQMTQISSEIGYPRHTSETPYEYLKTLVNLWPNHQQDVQLITRAYVKVRYGEFPETREEFEAIKMAWERVKTAAILGRDEG